MSHRTCKIDGCEGRVKAWGWCEKHYDRWRNHGNPHTRLTGHAAGKVCSVDGCSESAYAREWCQHHYNRNYHSGEATDGIRRPRYKTPQESFAARTEWEGDCLVWQGSRGSNGYGQISVGKGKMHLVHRWVWEQEYGAIPARMQIDHTCHNPPCANIKHLRLATPKQQMENMLGAHKGSTSQFRGVHWDEPSGKWSANVGHNDKVVHLGSYDSERDAAHASLGARLALYKFNLADRSVLDMQSSPRRDA